MRGKAWRRYKNISKYITRLKNNLYYCSIEDKARFSIKQKFNSWKIPKNWKEFKNNSHFANLLKNTKTINTYKSKQIYNHHSIKIERRESKKSIIKQIVESFDK